MKEKIMGLTLLSFIVSAPAFAYTEHRELQLDAVGIESMEIICGAGTLNVEGTSSDNIRVMADIEISGMNDENSKTLVQDKIDLWLLKTGKKAQLKSEVYPRSWSGSNAVIHLAVFVPSRFHLDIKDGSGSMKILSVQGDVQINDGSGGIEIRNSGGDLNIDDDSGNIDIENVLGSATIKDGSGNISIEDLQGSVVIDDGSGNISIYRVGADLTIKDGSGSITVRQVQGSVMVDDGSGSIDIQDVEKRVVIERDSSGSRHISNVRGSIVEKE